MNAKPLEIWSGQGFEPSTPTLARDPYKSP